MSAYFFRVGDYNTKAVYPLSVLRGTYSRVVNDTGRVELEVLRADIDSLAFYLANAWIAMYYRGRIEDIWTIMDYERTRFGTVRLYGENIGYYLAGLQRNVPSDSSASVSAGEVASLMLDALRSWFAGSALFSSMIWYVNQARVGFNTTVKYSMGTTAGHATAISDDSHIHIGSRYHIVWYVRGSALSSSGFPTYTAYIVIPRHRSLRPDEAFAPSVKFAWSDAYTAFKGMGKGLGSDRDVVEVRTPLAFYGLQYRATSASSNADDAQIALRTALRRGAGAIIGEIFLQPNLQYYDRFELGDILAVPSFSMGGRYITRQITGQVRAIKGEFGGGVVQHRIELVR